MLGAAAPGVKDDQASDGALRTLVILTLASMLSYLDRSLPGILIEPMRVDLGVDDTGIALMNGMAFALCFALASLPLGSAADRFNRVHIIAAGVAGWSLLTAACGLAGGFWTMFLCRMGVGFGEAALVPAAFSLLAARFGPASLPRALGFFALGAPIGGTLALAGGGAMVQFFSSWDAAPLAPWRLTFLTIGLAGLVIAALVLFIREPMRAPEPSSPLGATQTRAILPFLVAQRSFLVPFIVAVIGYNMFTGGYLAWIAPFFQRTYGWSIAQTGQVTALVMLAGSLIGGVGGGWLAGRLTQRRGSDQAMNVIVGGTLLLAPVAILMPLSPNGATAAGALFVMALALFSVATVVPAALLAVAPARLHARVTAAVLFAGTIVGAGLGPLVFAAVTEHVLGDAKLLRYSLLLVSMVTFAVVCVTFAVARGRYDAAIAIARDAST